MDDYNHYSQYQNVPAPEPPRRNGKKIFAWLLCFLIAGGLLGCFISQRFMGPHSPQNSQDSTGTSSSESASAQIPESSPANSLSGSSIVPQIVHSIDNLTIAEIASKAAPSVVEITTESVVTGSSLMQYISSGAGSGVIISEDGYILTNNHVIEGASNITVTTNEGQSYPAAVIGLDETLDVALLKVDAKGLTAAKVTSSAGLVTGQEVVAIGNPLGQLGGTVTNGIISALNRSITISDRTMNLLQTNAAINPGNSGGGLFDASGNLVGLVVAKYSDEEIEGIGFAIPIDDIMAVLDDLYNHGYVTGRVSLGMSLLDISSQQMAWMYRVSRLGVYVYQMDEDGAAARSGLRSGDCILSFNGTSVSSSDDINQQLSHLKVGDTVTLEVYRSGMRKTYTLTVGEYIPEGITSR